MRESMTTPSNIGTWIPYLAGMLRLAAPNWPLRQAVACLAMSCCMPLSVEQMGNHMAWAEHALSNQAGHTRLFPITGGPLM